ncbi:hypothetical protein PENTCL1PPCAC_26579, partial [Pristionchus entomophagus]
RMKSLYVLLFSSLAFSVYARDQTVGIRGTLTCGSEPLAGAEVKLWELDTWPDPDDNLATVKTDSRGRFEIFGSENEFTSISPVIKFYHRCNNKGLFNLPKLCKRKITYEIPKKYINSGKQVGTWFEMGEMNMEAKVKGEDTECI